MSARWSRFCPRCGSRNVVDATQCARCQQELHGLFAPGVRPIVCAACNGDVPPSAIYRPGCGRRLDDQRSSVLPGSSGPVEGLDFRRDVLLRDAIKRTEARGSSGAGCVRWIVVTVVGLVVLGAFASRGAPRVETATPQVAAAIVNAAQTPTAPVPPTSTVAVRVVYVGAQSSDPTPVVFGAPLPTSTRPPVATAASRASAAPQREQAQRLDPRELVADPKRFVGQNVVLRGRAINVDQKADYTWVNFDAYVQGRTTSEQLVVEFRPKQTGILRDDCYLVYGVAAGTQGVQFVFTGASKEAAFVNGYAWDALPRGESFACADPSPTPTPRPTVTPVPPPTPRPPPTVTIGAPRVPAPGAQAQPGR